MASSTSIDLTPPHIEFTVLENEPHTVLIPVTEEGEAVDLVAKYPQLTSCVKINEDSPSKQVAGVQDLNVAVITFPALSAGSKVLWELRDDAGDRTWLTGRVNVVKDALVT